MPSGKGVWLKGDALGVKAFQSVGSAIITAHAWPFTAVSRFATPPIRTGSAPETIGLIFR